MAVTDHHFNVLNFIFTYSRMLKLRKIKISIIVDGAMLQINIGLRLSSRMTMNFLLMNISER